MSGKIISTLSILITLTLCSLFVPGTAQAGNPYINIPEMQRLTAEAQSLWWNSLTARQKQLVRAIGAEVENHRRHTGQSYIPLTQENLSILMRRIGAYSHEAGFVYQRMQVHAQAGQAIDQVDRFLDYAQRNPKWYLPPSMQ